ncbi:IS110 family transposase [Clostridium saccharobutylicum]|uniref:Insertion element IS116 n=1 Tax=Clostridium saccharobutylicum DSM 13864 TaxID=1345695 RepID=U5MVJ1_CLOSA|nr:IS110 family transposase [Clostridium saccharobutylicum]AGX44615.1 insertion element IS116 [Clostridium saccharobutylicum DSM 13864]AQR91905.1 transposase IS116/IS110/IS902 family protein [Clostridium saccharobutylicum]AQS01807.1 transposase IS116/IS110/IS902 family protein [Clostridium saccharobutylicum]AQS15790.1 transposase IS116/IS110/IS902 family protein [Clostridium saccharobutylicum]MBA2903392.1 transposase [Clostridium saccharobutylicum]
MYIVGIDIGKNNHEATIIDNTGTIIGKSLKFTNSHSGANKLITYISKNIGSSEVIFGLEATGHYWLSLYSFLLEKGYSINVINPIQSDSFRNLYIRQTKNDTVDSFIIAEVIRFGRFTTTQLANDKLLSLRQLCRYRLSLVDSVSELKCRIITVLDQVFPEYEKLFSDTWGISSKKLLEKYQTPEDILEIDTSELADFLKEHSRGQLGYVKAEKIKDAAQNTFGIKIAQNAFKFQLKQLIDQVLFIENQIKSLDKEIEFYYNQFDCHLTSIPGIGAVTAAIILSEIGDVTRFKNASSLVAYAGIDPTVKQSGQFLSNNNKMSKRGSPYLRRALFLAASTCTLHESPLNDYYNKKRSEGKHHLTAVGAVAHKLTHIVFAIMRDNKDYEPMS